MGISERSEKISVTALERVVAIKHGDLYFLCMACYAPLPPCAQTQRFRAVSKGDAVERWERVEFELGYSMTSGVFHLHGLSLADLQHKDRVRGFRA